MHIKYSINKIESRIIFCPDEEGLKIIKKNVSSTAIAGDLSRLYSDKKILLIIDKKINKKITKYLIHDLKISNFKMSIMMVSGNKNNKDIKIKQSIDLSNIRYKPIIIGRNGETIKKIRECSQNEISNIMKSNIHLYLQVNKVND